MTKLSYHYRTVIPGDEVWKKKKKRSSSLKVILEKGNSLVPAETIKVLIKNIKIPHANNPTAKTVTVEWSRKRNYGKFEDYSILHWVSSDSSNKCSVN